MKRIVPVWPVGMSDESAEIEDHGVRGWPAEPMSDEVIEYVAESGFKRARLPKPVKSVMPMRA